MQRWVQSRCKPRPRSPSYTSRSAANRRKPRRELGSRRTKSDKRGSRTWRGPESQEARNSKVSSDIRKVCLDRMVHLMKADDEYRRLLKVLERDPDFDHEEIEMFKKTELVRKSIDLCKLSAKKQ